jgi:hypothetical protein
MAKKAILPILIAAALGAPAHAGEVKIHLWPVEFIPQEITEIPVLMDIGFFVRIDNQDDLRIKLLQVSIDEYEGCTDMSVTTNFDLTLSCKITPNGAVAGKYSCSILGADINAPRGTATVCAQLKDADLTGVPGGTRDVRVATVTILVVPR